MQVLDVAAKVLAKSDLERPALQGSYLCILQKGCQLNNVGTGWKQ